MKLKKVVSLALAGVMAVSMLAGCGTNKPEDPSQDDNGTVKAGYSAEFEKIADIDLDYVAFQDSTVDQDALKAAVASCTDVQLYAALVGGNLTTPSPLKGAMWVSRDLGLRCTSVFSENADLDYNFAKTYQKAYVSNLGQKAYVSNLGWYFDSKENSDMTNTVKAGAIAAVDGTMDTNSVLAMVEDLLNNDLATLPENGKQGGITVEYKYTVSVSLVSRTTTMSDLAKADMDFVAVTVTRTGTVANA